MTHVSIIGAGAWGTALGLSASRAGCQVTLCSARSQKGQEDAIGDEQAVAHADLLILVPPAQAMRSVCERFQEVIKPHTPLIIASKGIEKGSALLMSEVVHDFFPANPLLVLSGPSFAQEVVKEHPTAVVLAADDLSLSQPIADLLRSKFFHVQASNDIIGVQVGGALKNIIAIACGIVAGRDLGDNARAAVLSQGLGEVAHLGCAMGARLETFLGLAGVGDITLTSFSTQSRNKSFGLALGRGTPLKDLLGPKKALTEGVHTVSGALTLAHKHRINMPLTFAMDHLLNKEGTMEIFIETILNWKD